MSNTSRPIDDNSLVADALKGNEQAFTTLMDRHKSALYHTLLKMTGNIADAEDLTVEAFSKAFKNLHKYNSKYAFSTWLFTIATNNCLDFIRHKKTVPFIFEPISAELEGVVNRIPTTNLDPEEQFVSNQTSTDLKDVVSSLKPEYRTIIELRYFKEYTYEEIASELNIPIGSVKTTLYRAKKTLQKLLLKNEQTNSNYQT